MHDSVHSFHIPVMGISFTIDTPLKVARFGISSVVSIVDDQLLEDMRMHYCRQLGKPYEPITSQAKDSRARRITASLDSMQELLTKQLEKLKLEAFVPGADISKYFELLPASPLKKEYQAMLRLVPGSPERIATEAKLRSTLKFGSIDVNIMAKVDKDNYAKDGSKLPAEFADAMAALRGFAQSKLHASLVLSAGYNPRLYSYLERFDCFYPDAEGLLFKQVILKVSDYRSAHVQGKILAKKGIWVAEFRIESGLNCGGHAFPTEGILQGPILEEFREKRAALRQELFGTCNESLRQSGRSVFLEIPKQRITAQGGVGTADEHSLLLDYYGLDSVGWGSPFLLVPEATGVDEHTREQLAVAKPEDYYLSHASPLGVPFNNFRPSTSEAQRKRRIEKDRPGSPCYKKYLSANTEFTEQPICTSSRQYQHLKIKQLEASGLPEDELKQAVEAVVEKDCLCEGLSVSASHNNDLPIRHNLTAVTICPGPNLAFFSGTFSLREMIDHIYGRGFVGNAIPRPHVFVNELQLYIRYFRKELNKGKASLTEKLLRSRENFRKNLLLGIEYYRQHMPYMASGDAGARMLSQLSLAEDQLMEDALVLQA
ncbi:MAG: hypothetical protein JST06_05525 [Bacteroidetes bacterium]|nr:hypothetical protein [Bacteroidota bacterium]